jgi:hypothetical protein
MFYAAALTFGFTAGTAARADQARPFTEGTPVVIVGEISSQPKNARFAHESKLQVAVGPNKKDHTLHIKDAKIFNANGLELAKSDLVDKMWIRAEGTVMDDARRIKITRMTVLGRDPVAFRTSSVYQPGFENGYVEKVAGSREVFTSTQPAREGMPVVAVGRISSAPKKAKIVNEGKMQVAIGPDKTDYTLHIDDARIYDSAGREMAKSDLTDDMWVRAEGTFMDDPRRVKVTRLEVVGRTTGDFRTSPSFRTTDEFGYVILR